MRRVVQRVLETYGYSPKRMDGSAETPQGYWDFVLKYLLPTVTLIGFAHWVGEISVAIASAAYLLALAVFFRGFWAWCNTRLKTAALLVTAGTALLAFAWLDYNWIREEWTPTFLYLAPSHELIDCERRAFLVSNSGLKGMQNIKIIIKDNKSGAVLEDNDYRTGIEPGPQNPDAPRYIWVKPSHPWDEDYTIIITGTKFRSVQETVLRSTSHDVSFAVRIILDAKKKPVASCRDDLLPETYSLGRGSSGNCNTLMAVDPGLLNRLRPEPYGFQLPNGVYSAVRIRTLPAASDLDAQSEDRHLTEYVQTIMKSKLAKYRGTKLLVLYAGGPKTLTYATEFRDFLRSLGWQADGPRPVPADDEGLVDVQISVSKLYRNNPYPRATDLLESLQGVKHRRRNVYDDAIPRDLIVFWVGPKSPDNFSPDDCASAQLRPRPGEPHTCEFVAQSSVACPLVPQ
jgi:hypothetical protein